MDFDGILFFPVTPFTADGTIDHELLAAHVATGVEAGAGGVFPACGTGEFHALSESEAAAVTRTAVSAVAGRVPVIAGAGGPLGHAIEVAKAAADAGADGLLVLPPYLVGGTQAGLAAYVEQIIDAADLPVIIYHRGSAQDSVETVRRLVASLTAVQSAFGVPEDSLSEVELVITSLDAVGPVGEHLQVVGVHDRLLSS